MQKFETLRQPLLGEIAMSWREERKREREKNAIYSGQLRLCLQPKGSPRTPLGPISIDKERLTVLHSHSCHRLSEADSFQEKGKFVFSEIGD